MPPLLQVIFSPKLAETETPQHKSIKLHQAPRWNNFHKPQNWILISESNQLHIHTIKIIRQQHCELMTIRFIQRPKSHLETAFSVHWGRIITIRGGDRGNRCPELRDSTLRPNIILHLRVLGFICWKRICIINSLVGNAQKQSAVLLRYWK
jgi:hypothetical protein